MIIKVEIKKSLIIILALIIQIKYQEQQNQMKKERKK